MAQTINNLSPYEALNILEQATGKVPLVRQDHRMVENALLSLRAYIMVNSAEKVVPAKDGKPDDNPSEAAEVPEAPGNV